MVPGALKLHESVAMKTGRAMHVQYARKAERRFIFIYCFMIPHDLQFRNESTCKK